VQCVSVRLCGIDLVLEVEAHRVTDASTVERVAGVHRRRLPASVEGDALTAPYSAPSAGPAPWHLYRLALHTAVGVAIAESHGATGWECASARRTALAPFKRPTHRYERRRL
jgi:hypothetical protein